MAVKTILATGCSGGLVRRSLCAPAPWLTDSAQGFELIKQLVAKQGEYRFILGVRDPSKSRPQFDALAAHAKDAVTLLPLDLANLKTVRTFAHDSLEALGSDRLDYVLLNAAYSNSSTAPGPHGSRWCEPYVVNQCVVQIRHSPHRRPR